MEKFVEQTLLFDFYGELLTEHQRRIYEEVVCDDFSVSEIARDEGISRQGVHDLIKRCNKILQDYEQQLHLVERFLRVRSHMRRIRELTDPAAEGTPAEKLEKIDHIAAEVLEEL